MNVQTTWLRGLLVAAVAMAGGADVAWGEECPTKYAERSSSFSVQLPNGVDAARPFDLRLLQPMSAKPGICENATWVKFNAELSAVSTNNRGVSIFRLYNSIDTQNKKVTFDNRVVPLDVAVYVDTQAVQPFDPSRFALIPKPLPTNRRGDPSLNDIAFDVQGDDVRKRQVLPVLVEPTGRARYRLVLIVCTAECTQGAVDEIRRNEGQAIASEPAPVVQPVAGAPAAAVTSASDKPAPAPTAEARPVSIVAKPVPGGPAKDTPQPQRPGGRPPVPPAPVAPVVAAYAPPQPTGYFNLGFYDPRTGKPGPIPKYAHAVWGDCSTREDFGASGETGATGRVIVYGAKQPNQTLCIVLRNEPSSEKGEGCLLIVPQAVTPALKPEGAPQFFYGSTDAQLPPCGIAPAPWTVKFQHNGAPLDPELADTLIDPKTTGVGGLALTGHGGRYEVSLRRETLDVLSTPDQAKALDQIQLDTATFKRISVAVDRPQRTISVSVEPLVVNLAGLKFEFWNGEGQDRQGSPDCNLELDVPKGQTGTQDVRRGAAWQQLLGTEPLILRHGGGEKYTLRIGKTADDALLRKLFVELSNGDVQGRAIRLKHTTKDSETGCYLVDTALKDSEITSVVVGQRVIKRTVGQPQPALIMVLTTDKRVGTSGMTDDAYQSALTATVDVLSTVPSFITESSSKPFSFTKLIVGNANPAKPLIDPAATAGSAFSTPGLALIEKTLGEGLRERSPAVPVNDVRRVIEDVFTQRGIAIGGGRAPPAALIHIGDVMLKPGAGDNFCNATSPGAVARSSDWLPDERQLLKISFATQATIDELIAKDTLKPIEVARGGAISSCAHNVAGRVEEYIIAVPKGQIGAGAVGVRETIIATVQRLFKVKAQ